MENNVLKASVLLLFLAAVAAAQVHDIEVAEEYSQSVGGIRISYDNVTIMDEVANLSIGKTYEVRYKIKNLGDYVEKANITVLVRNLTRTWVINLRSRTVDAKKSIYLSENWNIKDMSAGIYMIIVEARVSGDVNSSNDNRTRNVTLFGHSAATTTTSRTTTSAASTSSSTSTTKVEDEDKTTTTRKVSTTTTSSSIKPKTTSTSAAVLPSTSATSRLQTTTTTRKTATTTREGSTASGATTSSSTTMNAATGKVVGISTAGRQTIVVFLILLAGAVLYLSKK